MENETKALILSQIAEVELIYKSKVKASERPKLNDSRDCYNLFLKLWDDGKINLVEQFKMLFLNRANRVVGFLEVSSGGITGTIADPRIILVGALKVLACSIVICHNHPSANLSPSKADQDLTKKIKHACAFHDIKLLDHIILSDEGYYSFADEGLL
jgi:DNA repair protein RadC